MRVASNVVNVLVDYSSFINAPHEYFDDTALTALGAAAKEFLQRHTDGRWYGVRQGWLDQLPAGFIARIRHGIRIDPTSLRGEAGFYGDRDPNCCPSQRLLVDLELRADSLVLRGQTVVAEH